MMRDKNIKQRLDQEIRLPDQTEQALHSAYAEIMGNEEKHVVKRWGTAAAAVMIALACVGGSVYAASKFHLTDRLIQDAAVQNEQAAESSIQELSDADQVVEDIPEALSWVDTDGLQDFDKPLFKVTESYFDGSVLYIYGEATEAGRDYDFATDRFIINGEQYPCMFESVAERKSHSEADAQQDDIYRYIGYVQLAELNLTDNFKVELPINVYPSLDGKHYSELTDKELGQYKLAGIQTVGFQVEASDQPAKILENMDYETEKGHISLDLLTMTPSTLHYLMTYHVSGENAEEEIKKLSSSCVRITDDQGQVVDTMFNDRNPVGEGTPSETQVYQDDDGSWYTQKEYYFSGISYETQHLTIMPYEMDWENNTAGEDMTDYTITVEIP